MSEASTANQAPPAPVEVPTDSCQDAGQGKKVEAPQGKDKNQDKGKGKASEFREELRKAREAAQLLKEATEAEKQAAYALGVQETQSRFTEEFSAVARDYYDITWGKALDVAGIPVDSSLRQPKSIYYDSDIRELPGSGSPPPGQPAQVSEAPTTNQAPPTPVEVPTDSRQDASQGNKVEALQGKDKNQNKGKGKASDTAFSQSKQAADPRAPKAQA